MKAIILLTIFTPILAPSLLALTPVRDQFSAKKLNTSLWHMFNERTGTLSQSGGRVYYTMARTPEQDEDGAGLTLLNNTPRYNESWQVILDVRNTTGKGDEIRVGITITNAADPYDNVNFEFHGKGNGGGFNLIGVTNDLDDETKDITVNPQVIQGSMRISFSAKTKLFTFWHDNTGSADGYQWSRLGTFSPTGRGGDRSGNWRMTNSSGRFYVNIVAHSDYYNDLSKGQVSFDNFVLKAAK
jgi:hypothetical protein